MRLNKKRGFTLIELLVVVAIISLLASIVFASLSTARAKGRDARRMEDLHQIAIALELYFDDNGYYPSDLYTLLSPTGKYISSANIIRDPSASNNSSNLNLLAVAIPQDPLGADGGICRPNYCYTYPDTSPILSYHLGARMEIARARHGTFLGSGFNSINANWSSGFDGTASDIYDIEK